MPPRINKKKRNNAIPSLSFVTSPTPCAIKFPNSGNSQSQPLEVPTVPYTEGGKWVSKHFTQSDTKITKLPLRRTKKSKLDVSGIVQNNQKRATVSGFELQHHSSRSRSSTAYLPLQVTVSSKTTAKKRHSRHSREGKSDIDKNNSSHSAEKTMRAVSVENENRLHIQTENMEDDPPLAFSVKTPTLASRNVDTTNMDRTLRLQRSYSLTNLEDRCHSENDCCASPQNKNRLTLRLFQSSGSEDSDGEDAEVLAPDTPEHECQFTFYQRRLKARHRGVKHLF